jgi:hypothetical protein
MYVFFCCTGLWCKFSDSNMKLAMVLTAVFVTVIFVLVRIIFFLFFLRNCVFYMEQ